MKFKSQNLFCWPLLGANGLIVVCNVASCWPAMLHPFLHEVYAPINVNPVGGGGSAGKGRGFDA